MAEVRYEGASRIYSAGSSNEVRAVNELDLDVVDGELLVLVGPSGSGKSTALRMLAGLEPVNEGRILIDNKDVSLSPPQDRDIAMVFQNYALYPQMTVGENMGFALKQQKVPKDERRKRVEEAAGILDLLPYLDRKPKALSGGQRQRVAMGRAIVREPKVFLMDEPLSNLDAKLRVQTRTELVDLQARLGVTTVYVTHDQVEAMTMGHRVAVLDHGVLQQVDTPRRLYSTPANLFVAGFIGSPAMNLVEVERDGDQLTLGSQIVPLPDDVAADLRASSSKRFVVGVRPEHLAVDPDGSPCSVTVVEELGSEAFLHLAMAHQGGDSTVVIRVAGETSTVRGDKLAIAVAGPVHVFDAEDGSRLGTAIQS
ncbi:MAG: ABC transporter ATP-binding protein [Acidimicrobiales bacterium]